MPLRNELFGVFKLVQILEANGTSYKTILVSKATKKTSMEVKQQNYIQGTAESRILDIGQVSETISVEAPILVGGGSAIDGRSLLIDLINRAADRNNYTLPIMENGTVTVSADTGGSVSFTLKSDGDIVTPSFKVINPSDANPVPEALDPVNAVLGPTRVARNYDFTVQFGPYVAYVQNATVKVDVDTQPTQFLIPYNKTTSDPRGEFYKMGTQLPYLGVAGIKINGNGTAAVMVSGTNDPQLSGAGLTFQTANTTVSTDQPVIMRIGSVDLFSGVDISKSVINSTDFNVSNGIITVGFGFTSWVSMSGTGYSGSPFSGFSVGEAAVIPESEGYSVFSAQIDTDAKKTEKTEK